MALAGCGCAAAFFGAAKLQSGGPAPGSLGPLLAGVAMIVALVIYQYRSRWPLMPVRQLATTFPVCGILAAMCASAAAFGLMELILTALQGKSSPGHAALLFLPEFGAAVLTAVLFGALFRTRFTPGAGRRRPGYAHRRRGAAGLNPKSADADAIVAASSGLIGLGRRRLGVTGAVHHRVLAALDTDSACLRAGRAVTRGHRLPGRADLAVPGHRCRNQPDGGDPHLGLDLPGHRGWRRAAGHGPVRARRRAAAGART